ncbi:MAG TPA: DUF6600 domain-containing protein, partial [Labilithrix sp.]|nr:DUF6600 domain-containing protein [Labilithrix sp.]
MFERSSRWITSLGAAMVAGVGLLSAGCGAYEPEPEHPQRYSYVAPAPPTAAELAAEQQAREQAAAESREIVVGADDDEYSDTDPSALTEFKPALDGHGAWVDDGTYGTVWVPARDEVGADFQPYVTAGHWTYSDATDYVWVSDYSWGWAPFHYGRWVLLPGHGWAWIPGRRYAGAWVTWRLGPAGYGYVGWAPAPPIWYWNQGVAYGWSFGFYDHHHHYVYCPRTSVYHPEVATHVVRGPAAREHDGRTQDYVPARPSVGDERVVANPSVDGAGDRVVARPSVGGERVVANPGVGEPQRTPATPVVGARGPRPDELGVKQETVLAPPASNQGLGRARALAEPSTAVALGAAAPAHLRPAPPPMSVEPPPRVAPLAGGPASIASIPPPSRGMASAAANHDIARIEPVTPPPVHRLPPSTVTPSPPPSFSATAPANRAWPTPGIGSLP